MACNEKSQKANDNRYICNPISHRWVLRSGRAGKKLEREQGNQQAPRPPPRPQQDNNAVFCNEKSPKANDNRYICNPVSKRWVKRSGRAGKKLEKEQNQQAPPPPPPRPKEPKQPKTKKAKPKKPQPKKPKKPQPPPKKPQPPPKAPKKPVPPRKPVRPDPMASFPDTPIEDCPVFQIYKENYEGQSDREIRHHLDTIVKNGGKDMDNVIRGIIQSHIDFHHGKITLT